MKALFIGGTGTISSEVTRLAAARGWEVTLLNRGTKRHALPDGVGTQTADINDEALVKEKLKGQTFDVVANFIVFTPDQVERDLRLFSGKTGQYMFISSASAYQKPVRNTFITERTPLENPHWQYSRNKIACEALLTEAFQKNDFPATIIRPSHTYDKNVPVPIHGKKGSFQVLRRIQQGKPVLVSGDGTSLWTLTHSSDFAKAFVGLMGNPKAIGEAFHITGDERLTWDQVLAAIGRALGKEALPYHVSADFLIACDPDMEGTLKGDKSHCVIFDNSRVKSLVADFVQTTFFEQGAREAVRWMLAHPQSQTEDPAFDDWCDRVIAAHEAGKLAFQKLGGV